ncbi:MAG: 2OG-Fe(II) oxygenase family protein [Minisyncoccota bacterium]
MNKTISDIKTKGFVSVAYPNDLRQAVEETVLAWKKFCELPLEVKQSLPYSNNADGVGYEFKDGEGNKADRKENFDVALSGKSWLIQNISKINNTIALDFVKKAVLLVDLVKPQILDFSSDVEKEFGVDGLTNEVDNGNDVFFIRFIHYFGERDLGEETASAHTDQSGFTLHLFESAAGLQCLPYKSKSPDDFVDMPVSVGETVIIPSMQLQLRSEGKLTALCHRVVATPETVDNGRYSAVCFVQLKDTPKYDKERHGRLQEKTPGFNYQMVDEVFSDLFKK